MAVKKRLLLIDSDDALRAELADQISRFGEFETQTSPAVDAYLGDPDAMPADIILIAPRGGEDAADLTAQLRARDIAVPMVILGRGPEGEDADADEYIDYIAPPVRITELLAHLRRQLREYERSDEASVRIGPYEFQPAFSRLRPAPGAKGPNKIIRLTDKETSILRYLYRAGGEAVSRQELLHEVWGYHSDVTTHTLETHVYRLRQKIEPDKTEASLLLTDGGGYRLNLGP